MKTAVIFLITFISTLHSVAQSNRLQLIQKLSNEPEFPGGKEELLKFIEKNIWYPDMEHDNDVQGEVKVRFKIDENGVVGDVKIISRISPGIDKSAIKAIKSMPTWKPAMYHNKPIPSYYILPIRFSLVDSLPPIH